MNTKKIKYLSAEDLIAIHDHIVHFDPLTMKGIQSKGLIKSLAEKPSTALLKPDGLYIPYPDIYYKAASLLEAGCQWHVFVDGNKRTSIMATDIFLAKNGYYLVNVIETIRFAIMIADPKINYDLPMIVKWIKRYSSRYKSVAKFRSRLHQIRLYFFILLGTIFPDYIDRKIDYWFAFDIDPRYKEEWMKRLEFWSRNKK